jgi:hypothetical protein
MPELGLIFWRIMVMNPKTHPVNCQGYVPVSNNFPTLLHASVGWFFTFMKNLG